MIDESKFLIFHDLIGIKALAKPNSRSKNKNYSPIGIVIDETRDMLLTQHDNIIKKYVKKDYKFKFKIPQNKVEDIEYYLELPGSKIIGLPINRLRSLKKKRWLKNE
ncbi:MAG: ribonuclease P protein subunit [Candidatus Thorarchaeota archaeon]